MNDFIEQLSIPSHATNGAKKGLIWLVGWLVGWLVLTLW
jgi:hypothetical protein